MQAKQHSLVSIIIPTKNSSSVLGKCLQSIKKQTYKYTEIIVVDNHSTDSTVQVAKKFTGHVYIKGPERSKQRNDGAKKASGDFFFFVDSDMELSPKVVESCINKALKYQRMKKKLVGIIIPEKSYGEGFWAACKQLEKSYYEGLDWIESPRFFPKQIFNKIGGYSENMISGEDWDISIRVRKVGDIARIKEYIYHDESKLSLLKDLQKKFYYSTKIKSYRQTAKGYGKNFNIQANPINRYKLFLSKPDILFRNPILGLGMLYLKTMEYIVGALGYVLKS